MTSSAIQPTGRVSNNSWIWKRSSGDNLSLDIDLNNDFDSRTHGDVMLKEIIREKESYIDQLIEERNSKMKNEVGLISNLEESNLQENHLFNAQIKELNKKILQIEKENTNLKIRYEEEQKRVEDLTFEVEETHIDNSALKDANEKCESRFQDVSQSLKQEKARCQDLSMKLNKMNGRLAAETLRVKEADQSSRLYMNQVQALQTRKKQLQEHLTLMTQEFNEDHCKEVLAMKDEDIKENTDRIQSMEQKVKFATEAVKKLEECLSEWPDENYNQLQTIESLQKECVVLEEKNGELNKTCSMKGTELSNLEADRDNLKQKQKHLLANKENFEKTLIELGDEIKAVNQVEKLKSQLQEKDEELIKLRDQLAQIRSEFKLQDDSYSNELFGKSEALEMARESHASKILPHKQQMELLSKELTRWQNRYAQLESRHRKDLQNLQNLHASELSKLTATLNRLNQEYHNKGKNLNSILDLLDKALEKHKDVVNRLQSPDLRDPIQEKNNLSSTIEHLREERHVLKDKVQSTSQFLAQVKHQISRMTTEKDEAQQISEDLRKAEEHCKQELDRMNAELSSAQTSQTTLQTRLTDVQSEVEKLRLVQDGVEEDKKSRMDVQRKLNIVKSEMSVLKFAGDKITKETHSINDEVEKLKLLLKEKNELQKEREKLQELLKQTNAKCNELNTMGVENDNHLVEEDSNIQKLREEIDASHKKNGSYAADKEPIITRMVEENHELQKQILDLEFFIQKSSIVSAQTDSHRDIPQSVSDSSNERVQMLNKEVTRLRSRHKYLTELFQKVKKDPAKAKELLKSLEVAAKVDEEEERMHNESRSRDAPVNNAPLSASSVTQSTVSRRPNNTRTNRPRPTSMIVTSNVNPAVSNSRSGRTPSRTDESSTAARTRTRSTTPSGRSTTPQVTPRINTNPLNKSTNRFSAPPTSARLSASRSSTSLSDQRATKAPNTVTPRTTATRMTSSSTSQPKVPASGATLRRSATTATRPAPGTTRPISGVMSRTSSSTSISSTVRTPTRIQPASGASTQPSRVKPATPGGPTSSVTLRNRTSNVSTNRPVSTPLSASTNRINRTAASQNNPPASATPRTNVRPATNTSTPPNRMTRVNSQPTVKKPTSTSSLNTTSGPTSARTRPGSRQSQPMSSSISQLRRPSTSTARVSHPNDAQSSSASNLVASSSNQNLNDVIPSNRLRAQHQSFEATSSAVDIPNSSKMSATNRPTRRPAPGTHKASAAASTSALAIRRSNPVAPVSIPRNSNLMAVNRRPLTGNSTSQIGAASQRRDSLDNRSYFCDNCHKFGHSADECAESKTLTRSNSAKPATRPGLSSSTMRLLSEHKKSTS